MPRKNLQILMASLVAVLILVAIFGGVKLTQNSNSITANSSAQKSSADTSSQQNSKLITTTGIQSLAGEYSGQAKMLSPFLVFPITQLIISDGNQITANGEGLDLAVINNPKLKVGTAYPVAKVTATGKIKIKDAKIVELSIESIVPTFTVQSGANQEVLDPAATANILIILETYGIKLPVATPQAPLQILADYTLSPDSKNLLLKNQTDSPTLLDFKGSKK